MISTWLAVIGWILVIWLVLRNYAKQRQKPKLWKVFLAVLFGVFALTANWELSRTHLQIPILPLGVWILYGILRNRSWGTYRAYAWIGFSSHLIMLAAALLATPVQQWVYPSEELSTYIADVEEASVMRIHPSAPEAALDQELLVSMLGSATSVEVMSDEWYRQTELESEPNYRKEKFPYQLVGTQPRRGSGVSAIIHIENDAKGVLITTPREQYYYRFDEPLIDQGQEVRG